MRRSGAMGSRHASDRAQIKSRYGNVCLCALAPARMMLPPSAPAAFRVVAVGGATALAACGSSSTPSSTSSSPAAAGKPKKGGTLHAGLTGGTGSDTVDAHRGVDNVDFARIIALYDPLIGYDLKAQNKLALAESITPNAKATVWTVRLRPGVTFHNGKRLTAEDVIYSLTRIAKNNS